MTNEQVSDIRQMNMDSEAILKAAPPDFADFVNLHGVFSDDNIAKVARDKYVSIMRVQRRVATLVHKALMLKNVTPFDDHAKAAVEQALFSQFNIRNAEVKSAVILATRRVVNIESLMDVLRNVAEQICATVCVSAVMVRGLSAETLEDAALLDTIHDELLLNIATYFPIETTMIKDFRRNE